MKTLEEFKNYFSDKRFIKEAINEYGNHAGDYLDFELYFDLEKLEHFLEDIQEMYIEVNLVDSFNYHIKQLPIAFLDEDLPPILEGEFTQYLHDYISEYCYHYSEYVEELYYCIKVDDFSRSAPEIVELASLTDAKNYLNEQVKIFHNDFDDITEYNITNNDEFYFHAENGEEEFYIRITKPISEDDL